jgi:hypothetical protein
MSTGPGKVERAILALIERRKHPGTADLCRAAFGDPPWTKAQRVSVLRAMHRIVAREPGWTAERRRAWNMEKAELRFSWQPPPSPPRPKTKPAKVNEPIWAYHLNDKFRYVWRRAAITSRGGSEPHRVTITCDGCRWQGSDRGFGIHAWGDGAPSFCYDSERPAIEARARERRSFFTSGVDSVSAEALAMLGLSRPFTRADVQRAYRAKSMKAHPDQGGETDFFRALIIARDAALADADD